MRGEPTPTRTNWRTCQSCRPEAAQAKVLASETLQAVAGEGMQIMASAGYAAESAMNRILRDSRLYTFGEGANEMLRAARAPETLIAALGRVCGLFAPTECQNYFRAAAMRPNKGTML